MKAPMPEFLVSDIAATIKFYQDALGFGEAFTLPDANGTIVHASVSNGETMIMFGPLPGDLTASAGELGKGVTIYLILNETDDIDALFTVAEAAGATVLQTPRDEFWGDRTWAVADPDGYKIIVSKQVREVSMDEMAEAMAAMGAPA